MKCHLMNEFWYEFLNRYTGVCRRHINVNFSGETISTSKCLHVKLKKVCSSILLAVAILSKIVTTMLLENEAVFSWKFCTRLRYN